MECTSDCSDILYFVPEEGLGYWNMPYYDETEGDQYSSYLRRDHIMLIKYAAARVACKSADWPWGFVPEDVPLGLYDMSESDGSIPGSSIGEPRYPSGSHEDGRDCDLSYYRIPPAPDNSTVQSICAVSDNHCSEPPDRLDHWRTALFIGALLEHPCYKVIGMDAEAASLVLAAYAKLCEDGWIEPEGCGKEHLFGYETSDEGLGWFRWHYQYMQSSLRDVCD
jgi:hypothetical protein